MTPSGGSRPLPAAGKVGGWRPYTYDPLSRLSTALTTGSTNYPQWGLSWGYDRYGNRRNQTQTAGSVYQGSVAVNPATNHITDSPYSYDANGNMTNDGLNTLA